MLTASAPAFAILFTQEREQPLPATAPVSIAPPNLSGLPAPGSTLVCSTGTWSGNPRTLTYRWLRDGSPIAGQTTSSYTVQNADQGHALSCTVTAANEGGEYALSGLPTASYEVGFDTESPLNYLPQEFKEKPFGEAGDAVSVSDGTTTAGIGASLQSGAEVSGKVTSQLTGLALKEIEVCAYGATSHARQCAYTEASGEYTIADLPSDSYQVDFEATETSENFAPQYYNGKTSETQATPVTASAGSVTAGIDAALTAGGRISGTVIGSGSGPLANVEVCTEGSFGACATTNAEGKYTITNLATGKYTVGFFPVSPYAFLESLYSESGFKSPPQSEFLYQYYNEKASYEEADQVSVEAGATTSGINAALAHGGWIDGTAVAKESGSPVANVVVCATGEHSNEFPSCTLTSTSGEYKLEGLAETAYSVEFISIGTSITSTGIYAPQEYKDEEIMETGTPVNVKANVGTGGINAELVVGAKISGKVTSASSGAPLANVDVCTSSLKFTTCDETTASGEYSIAGIPSAAYDVGFEPPISSEYLEQFYNGKPSKSAATPLNVTLGSTYSGVNAALSVGGRITGLVDAASGGAPLAGVDVCAYGKFEGESMEHCALTQTAGPPASATSAAVTVSAATVSPAITIAKDVKLNTKTGAVTFTVALSSPGALSWSFVFKNADVGFVDALTEAAPASSARSRCKTGLIRHHGRCVHLTVPFASGKAAASAGMLTVTLHPGAKALKALRAGHVLHVSGAFTFQPSAGGARIRSSVSTVVRLKRKHRRG